MDYATLQQRINERLDNRSDLAAIIYSYSQDRIGYWQDFFWYSSDVTDTSIVTTAGQPWYDLPQNIRNLKSVRLLLAGGTSVQTTLTAAITLPQATIPVVSTVGFASSGTLLIAGYSVSYTGKTVTTFTGCSSGIGSVTSGSAVVLGGGVWVSLDKAGYYDILEADPLSPGNQAQPSNWAQFGLRLRLYLTPGQAYPLELTGNNMPPAPTADSDDNFWTSDAGSLIIADTAAEIYEQYLHDEGSAAIHRRAAAREQRKLLKVSLNLMGPLTVRGHL